MILNDKKKGLCCALKGQITLFEAFNLVSENKEINVSYETVRKAWYKHRETMNNDLVAKGLPSILV